jgi:hypothetical protein
MPAKKMKLRLIDALVSAYHAKFDIRMVPIKIDFLLELILERGYLRTVEIRKLEYRRTSLLGGVKVYGPLKPYQSADDSAVIFIDATLPKDEERFVICKELCHPILDEIGFKVQSESDLHLLVEHFSAPQFGFMPSVSEKVAEGCALEILFPYELRLLHRPKYLAGSITAHQLALRYEIPQRYIEIAMLDQYDKAVRDSLRSALVEISNQ